MGPLKKTNGVRQSSKQESCPVCGAKGSEPCELNSGAARKRSHSLRPPAVPAKDGIRFHLVIRGKKTTS